MRTALAERIVQQVPSESTVELRSPSVMYLLAKAGVRIAMGLGVNVAPNITHLKLANGTRKEVVSKPDDETNHMKGDHE